MIRDPHMAIYHAIKKGEITRPSVCSVDGCNRTDVEGHHHDYSKLLDVIWVCKLHHKRIHMELDRVKAN